MRGLTSNQIASIAFFLTTIFISLALSRVPMLISSRDAEMPSFYQEGMNKNTKAAAAATKAAAKPSPPKTGPPTVADRWYPAGTKPEDRRLYEESVFALLRIF